MRKNKNAFTLMEIVTVISIIVILAGLLYPALRTAREKAKEQKAQAMIGSLEVGVNMYYTDLGVYPPGLSQLTAVTNNYGPYMDNSRDYVNGNFRDPWGTNYNYTSNTNGYVISTTTPSGKVIEARRQ